MTYCIRCAPNPCGNIGIISVSINSSSSARPLDSNSCASSTLLPTYIPGPSIGNVNIQAYAFAANSKEMWGGTRCKGTAQASQSNIQRYDSKTDTWYLIPSRIHKAQIAGGFLDGGIVSMDTIFFEGKSYDSQILNGASLTTEMTVRLGASFHYSGLPIGISIPELSTYSIAAAGGIRGAFISSIAVAADYPNNPATVSYSFEFPLTK